MAQTMDISEIKRLYPDEWVLLGNPEVCYLGKPMIAGYQKTALFFNRVTPVTKRRAKASLSVLALATLMIFGGCGKDKGVTVTSVTLSNDKLALVEGDKVPLTATVQPANATDQTVTWSSSNNTVATVATDGTVTAVKAGTATITVTTTDGSKTAVCEVKVIPVAVIGVTLSETTLDLVTGAEATLIVTVAPANATNTAVSWESSNTAIATVADDGKVTAVTVGEAIITVTTVDGSKIATCAVMVYDPTTTIDEGVVINGVKWATRNVDAPEHFAATPESYGKFYQWNRAKAWNATGSVTGWDSTSPTGDAWAPANDPSPAGWRIPTTKEQQKLFDETKVENKWVTQNGVDGRLFTDKTTKASLLLPAAGYRRRDDGTLSGAGTDGYYWSSTAFSTSTTAYYLDTGVDAGWYGRNRTFGLSVRCVAE